MEKNSWDNKGEFTPWVFEKAALDAIPSMLSQHVPALRLPLKKDAGFLGSYLASFGPIAGKPGYYRVLSISPFTD